MEHQKKAEKFPEEFLKSRLFSSPKLKTIAGKIANMVVLVIGYDVEVQDKGGKEKNFKDILYREYEVQENGHALKLVKENNLNI